MKLKRTEIICCPYCKAEYLPAEIYVPKYFLGTVQNIIKDENGKIVDFDNASMETSEVYECDYCGKQFNVKSMIKFITSRQDNSDFTEEFNSSLQTDTLTLFEED